MNREQTKKLLAERSEQDNVMQHFVDRGEVECKLRTDTNWTDNDDPWWDFYNCNYRIKRILPEVGKWYIDIGWSEKRKCIAYEFNKYVFMKLDETLPVLLKDIHDFTNFKQVEP